MSANVITIENPAQNSRDIDPETYFSRNLGFFSYAEHERLRGSVVAIAGAGGDGGELAATLAQHGVGEIRLADPDPFEDENTNRQWACTQDTVGVNKAIAVGTGIKAMFGSAVKVTAFTEGITPQNAAEFIQGADLVIDETEFTLHAIGVSLARAAREQGIPNLMAMNIGFGGSVTSFLPPDARRGLRKPMTFEKMLGLSETASLDEIAEQEVDLSRWLAYIPHYGDINTFKKVSTGEKSAPSVAVGVKMACGIAAVQATLHLIGGMDNNRPKPVSAPHHLVVDAMTGMAKKIRHPRISHYRHLAAMGAVNLAGKAPKASY